MVMGDGVIIPADNIFLRSTADWFNNGGAGTAEQDIPLAPTINVGDTLFVFWNQQTGGVFAGPLGGGWSVEMNGTSPVFGDSQLYSRIASGNSFDNFTLPADTSKNARFAQMICVGNIDNTPISIVKTGTAFGNTGTDWSVNEITQGTGNQNWTVCCCVRQLEDTGIGVRTLTVEDSNPHGYITIGEQTGSYVRGGTTVSNLWVWWGYEYQEIRSTTSAWEQGYTTDPLSAKQWTNTLRYTRAPP